MYGEQSDSVHHNPTGWKRWAYSTNHKAIGTMYLIFAIIAGVIGSVFSVIMRMEFASSFLIEPIELFFSEHEDSS